jgi:putative membrane protein insertion efficiency factor
MSRGLAEILAVVLRGYQRWVSPLLPPACRFEPTCSEYARQALLEHGLVSGGGLTVKRLLRCHPWHPGGFDPVPQSPADQRK